MSYNYEILGTTANPAFQVPYDVALDINRNVYVADSNNDALRKIDTAETVTTIGATGSFPQITGVSTCIPTSPGGTVYTYVVGRGQTGYLQLVNTTADPIQIIDWSFLIYFDSVTPTMSVSSNADGTVVYVPGGTGGQSLCQILNNDPTNPLSNPSVTYFDGLASFTTSQIMYVCIDPTSSPLDPTKSIVYLTCDESIYKFDPVLGNFTLVLTGLDKLYGIAVKDSQTIYAATSQGSIIKSDSNGNITTISTSYALNVPYGLSVDPTGNLYVADIGNNEIVKLTLQNVVCFKEGAKILTDVGYKSIETLKKGDLVKTLTKGFVPIEMIGQKKMHNSASNDRVAEQLYICTQEFYPEVFEPLIITGCHSILVDAFENDQQREQVSEVLGNIYVTEGKYRLPACVDERSKVYLEKGDFTIYHIALENESYYGNYGVFANGLLVETCSRRYLKELANMKLLDYNI
jgi:hypothetical protein